jgi:hypothetical protein
MEAGFSCGIIAEFNLNCVLSPLEQSGHQEAAEAITALQVFKPFVSP